MRSLGIALTCLLLAALAAAQSPRTSTLVANSTGDAYGPSVAGDADLTAVLWFDSAAGLRQVQCAVSDGRGVAWNPAVRVDDGTTPLVWKTVYPSSLAVAGGMVYAVWADARLGVTGARDVWFQRSTNGGASFQPLDLLIDKGLAPGLADVVEMRMAVDPRNPSDPNDDLVALLVLVEDRASPPPYDEYLFLNYSTNSGASFLPLAIPFSGHAFASDTDFYDLAADGGRIHGVWHDDFLNRWDDHCYVSCYDPGLGGFAFQDLQLDALQPAIDADDEVAIDVRGPRIAVLFQEISAFGAAHWLMANESADGGVTWSGPTLVGSYLAGIDDVDSPDVALAAGGTAIAAWLDDRIGVDQVCSATSAAWSGDLVVSFAVASRPLQLACPDAMAAIVWEAPPLSPHFIEGALSPDAGASWRPPIPLSSNQGDCDDPRLAWSPAHANFVVAWMADDLGGGLDDPYAGGFRPQTLIPLGNFSVAGSPVSFQVQLWPHADRGKFFGVLASSSLGVTRLADGRDLGIANDGLFQTCLRYIPGALSGTLDAFGNGSTPTFGVPPKAGAVYAVAVAYTRKSSPGYITDVVVIP